MFLPCKSIVKFSFLSIVYSYGIWYGFTDVIFSFLPLGLVPALMILLAIQYLRIPSPTSNQIEKIMGKDFNLESSDHNILMKTIAHRGAGLDYPENSLIAFESCKERGCMYIEFDVKLTKDGVPIVFHDDNLERLANINLEIAESNWDDIKDIDIAVTHPYHDKFKDTHIPTLEETVTQLLASGQSFFIDLKDDDFRWVNIIENLYKRYPELYSKAIITTFFPLLLYFIRRADPKIVVSMAYRPYYFSHWSYSYISGVGDRRTKSMFGHYLNVMKDTFYSWSIHNVAYYVIGISIILLYKDIVSPQMVLDWRRRGVRVYIWTLNHAIDKQYFSRTLKCSYLTDTLTGENTRQLQPL